jgi:nucleosome binding factor SPN SPT16 subunit
LSYEFSETIIIFVKNKVVVLTSNRKKVLLEEMKAPEEYKGPLVEVILRDPNPDKQTENFDALIKTAFP